MIFTKNKFRAFTSIVLTFSFLILLVSGIVLFIMPHGRIAYWLDWRFWGINKDGWGSVHIIFGIVVVITGFFHLLMFNWKTFLSYFRNKARNSESSLGMPVFALVLCVFFFAGSSMELKPFTLILDAGESIKKSWITDDQKPPIPHAELMSINELCLRMDIPVKDAVARIKQAGIKIKGPGQRLAFIAKANRVSARSLYLVLSGEKQK